MPDPAPARDREEPIEDVVRDTVGARSDETTRREAVEQELEDRGRSEEGAEVEVSELVDAPAAGVLNEDLEDPPEPSEPG
jgi:hypothetical protein